MTFAVIIPYMCRSPQGNADSDRASRPTSDLRKPCVAAHEVVIRRDVVLHHAVVVLAVGEHVEVARASKAEDDRLGADRILAGKARGQPPRQDPRF